MKLSFVTLAVLGATVAVLASACGSNQSVPPNAVAVVDGTPIPREKLDQLMEQSKTAAESNDQEFPPVGTPEYQRIEKEYVAILVQRETYGQEAEKLGLEVTEKEIDKEVQVFVKDRYKGDEKAFETALEKEGFTRESFRDTIETGLLAQKLYDHLTKGIKVAPADIAAYYEQNKATQYTTPESRDVRHLLVQVKKGGEDADAVDFAKSKVEADALYAEAQGGADFGALIKEHSDDPTVEQNAGKLTVSPGVTVPEFETVALKIKQGVVSKPVKTQFGYHLVEALSPLRKQKVTPLEKVRASIRSTLLEEKKQTFVTEWAEGIREEYEGKITYATGFEPPELPDPTDTETQTTETGTD